MKGQPILFFDGYCNLCSSSVRFIERHQKKNVFRFLPLQSDEAAVLLERMKGEGNLPDSIILLHKEKVYTKSSAAIQIALKLRFPWPVLSVVYIVPGFLRDYIYDQIARNRLKWFGISDSCYIPIEK